MDLIDELNTFHCKVEYLIFSGIDSILYLYFIYSTNKS